MGDNRLDSSDSRNYFGNKDCVHTVCSHFLPRSYIVGRVLTDLGYFQIFKGLGIGSLKWERPIRLFDAPK